MVANWQQPDDWKNERSTISEVTGLKTGAWTEVFTAKETSVGTGTSGGKTADILLKTFTVPQGVHDDARIAAERARFLDSARLEQSLAAEGAAGWVSVSKISENPPSFMMPRYGPSLKDLMEHKVTLSANELYGVLQSVLQALLELKTRRDRSHGNLKASNVLTALPGESPPYKLADPAPKGESHSANDLYNLGLILHQLIEHKDYDPLAQLTPSKNWTRLGPRRDRWIQFLHLLLSPNGCQEPLADVRREALRLKPVSPLRPVLIGAMGVLAIGVVGGGLYEISQHGKGQVTTIVVTTATAPAISPEIKAAYEQAHQNYLDSRAKWSAAVAARTLRYDHIQSTALARESRSLVDNVSLVDAAGYQAATGLYQKAAVKLQAAVAQAAKEEDAGKTSDQSAGAGFGQVQRDYTDALARWNAAAAKFALGKDHSGSNNLAQAAQLSVPAGDISSDPAARRFAAEQYKNATAKLNQALALIPREDQVIAGHAEALAAFKSANDEYRQARDRWDAYLAGHRNFDLTDAKKLALEAKRDLEETILTDDASYRAAAERSRKDAAKLDQALALGKLAKPLVDPAVAIAPVSTAPANTQGQLTPETADNIPSTSAASPEAIAAAVARADAALKTRHYPEAFDLYKKAAELGSAPAMCNVGVFYETGTGTAKDCVQAAAWYRKAAAKKHAPALCNLASLYQKGKGVDQNLTQAFQLYRQAADMNHADAMVAVAQMLENGQGVDQSLPQALEWYKKAAALQNMAAITDVGVFYEKGRGVPVDCPQALTWYQKAAALNYPPAMDAVAALYDSGKYDNNKDTRPNHAEAFKWYAKAAALDDAGAMCNLGTLYDNGQGVAIDHAQAFRWFEKAANLNHPMAMYNLGALYEAGRGAPLDHAQAVTWYRKAAHADDPDARRLGLEALNRLGFSVDASP